MWPYPRILAHRGGGGLAPENTLAGLRCGRAHGFSGVEFDVMLARDAVPVLMHDPTFGRTVQGTGKVADFDAAELGRLDAGSWFSPAFAAERVPTLEQALQYCAANAIWSNIEIKPSPGQDVVTGRVVAALAKQLHAASTKEWLSDASVPLPPLLSSFSMAALVAARDSAPTIPRALLVDELPPQWRALLDQCGAVALHINHRRLMQADAAAVRQAGFGLFCYTVNDPGRARELLAWGVDAFCTDRLADIGPGFAGTAGDYGRQERDLP